jgi:nicotinamidase-related amidase
MASIYLVMDMENDLIHPDGPNGKTTYAEQVKARQIIPNTQSAIAKARAAGLPIGYVRVGFSPDYRECPPNSPVFSGARKNGLFKLGEWGTEIHADIAPQSGDHLITKHRVSPFYATSLEAILRARGITRIYCSGVSTNGVVHAAVREGHDRDYEMIVLEDCCCALTLEEHEHALASFKRYCSVLTISRDVKFQ